MRRLSSAKSHQIREAINKSPLFMPRLELETEAIYWQKYTDDWGHQCQRRIKVKILNEKPQQEHYQEKLKVLVLSGASQGKQKWVSRANVSPLRSR